MEQRQQAATPLDAALEAVREGAVLVTANNRLARALRLRYNAARVAAGEQVWASPRISSWLAWTQSLWEQHVYASVDAVPLLLSDEQETLVWEGIIANSPSNELISKTATAEAAREAWRLMHTWRLNRRDIEACANEDTTAFLQWADAFEAICREQRYLDTARLPEALAAVLGSADLPERLFLAGFDEVSPQQDAFTNGLRGAGVQVVLVESLRGERGDCLRVGVPNRQSEIGAAARWTRALLESGTVAGIAVVIHDLDSRRQEVERVFRNTLDPAAALPGAPASEGLFNISAGCRLFDYPLVRAALLALSIKPVDTELGPLGALLRTRYIAGGESERNGRAALDAKLRRMGAARTSTRVVRRLCRDGRTACPALRRALVGWERLRTSVPSADCAGGWARVFSRLLSSLGWPGEAALGSHEYQVSEAWGRLLSAFARLDAVGTRMSYSEAVARLKRMAVLEMFQPKSAPAPVQILGAMEASGARFDHLWITGMDDETWPPTSRPAPFLPLRVQRANALPHCSPERELEFSRATTERLLRSATNVVISHALHDGDRELGPSPLITELPAGTLEGLGLQQQPTLAEVVSASATLERFEDCDAPPLEQGTWQRGGTRVFQYQALCPFRAFAELRLGAQPLEEPEDGFGSRDRGTLLHLSLESVWRKLITHAELCAQSDSQLAALVRECVASSIETFRRRRGGTLPERLAELEQRRLETVVKDWLAIEQTRPPFTVVQPESERMIEVNGIRARVILDRIDRLEDGREIIIDYKTGEPNPKEWWGERPGEPQVPLYAAYHPAELAAALFAQVKAGKMKFKGLAGDPSPVPGVKSSDLSAQVIEWRGTMERLAQEFRSGASAVDPKKPSTCRYCHLACLCRIAEVELETSDVTGEME